MRAKVGKKKKKQPHRPQKNDLSNQHLLYCIVLPTPTAQSVLLSLFYDKEYQFLWQWDSIDVSTS